MPYYTYIISLDKLYSIMKHMIYRLYFLSFYANFRFISTFPTVRDCSLTLGIVYKTHEAVQTTANKH